MLLESRETRLLMPHRGRAARTPRGAGWVVPEVPRVRDAARGHDSTRWPGRSRRRSRSRLPLLAPAVSTSWSFTHTRGGGGAAGTPTFAPPVAPIPNVCVVARERPRGSPSGPKRDRRPAGGGVAHPRRATRWRCAELLAPTRSLLAQPTRSCPIRAGKRPRTEQARHPMPAPAPDLHHCGRPTCATAQLPGPPGDQVWHTGAPRTGGDTP